MVTIANRHQPLQAFVYIPKSRVADFSNRISFYLFVFKF